MTAPLSPDENEAVHWEPNYFNYFTEIEEHFQRARGTSIFLLSPLDWALIENWKNGGVPLEAVLRGIDDAFTKWRSRRTKHRSVNSLAYCAQAVAEAAQRTPSRHATSSQNSVVPLEQLQQFLGKAAGTLRGRPEVAFAEIGQSLEKLSEQAATHLNDLETLERHLSALEDKMIAIAHAAQPDADLFAARTQLDRELKPYRGKMTAEQLAMLERRFLDNAVLERLQLPRLSLFYLS